METLQEETPLTRRSRREAASPPAPSVETPATKKPRRRVSVFGVIGELFITVGVVVLLYVSWQLWIGDWIGAIENNRAGAELSEQWAEEYEAAAPAPVETSVPEGTPEGEVPWVEPPVLPQPGNTEVFGNMHIPRFGPEYVVRMAGGVTRAGTLDPIGIGHYPDSPMPGEVGNFAVAAHRTTFGAPFNRIAELRLGDAVVVETQEGWFTYRFRTLEYVKPSAVDVLLDVPQKPEVPAGDRYITMTSCSPKGSLAERVVGYGVFESFTPRSAGPPASLTEVPA